MARRGSLSGSTWLDAARWSARPVLLEGFEDAQLRPDNMQANQFCRSLLDVG